MSRARRYVCISIAPLLRRVRLPLIGRSVPVWALVAVATPLVLFGGGSTIVATNQPIFCKSCHEMGLHYATWSQSAHRGVGCEECHVMPGAMNMLRSKVRAPRLVKEHRKGEVRATAIQGHVPDANCKGCHPGTPALVTYHGLKITHKAHWEMGTKCTFCHDRVVHGPKWLYTGVASEEKVTAVTTAYKYTPTRESCYTCHDGKKAPNECSTCHVSLGERKPTAFDPAWTVAHREEVGRSTEAECARCHTSDFCRNCHRAANPHPRDWISRHPEEARQDPNGCPKCHLAPAERKPRDVAAMAFCWDCHGRRQEHKQANWQQVHGKESLADPASCERCHTASWCSACHAIGGPHPPEWLARHSAEASRDPKNCETCHSSQFCNTCHQGKGGIPASHENDWLAHHQEAARKPSPGCNTCHKADFCQRCHAKKPPASHSTRWLSQHGKTSQVQGVSCTLCHREDFCSSCHGLQMPHPARWQEGAHGREAAKDRDVCLRCHKEKDCTTCHGVAMPHPDDWMAQHGKQAAAAPEKCEQCHRPGHQDCNTCHAAVAPSSHQSATWTKDHPGAGASQMALCVACHGKDPCNTCHAKNAAKAKGK